MERLTVNLLGKPRRDTLDGREHIVVPLSMIVPGVLNGSKGPLLYTEEEIAKSSDQWNHMPIVVYHPSSNGQNISARDPDVLNVQGVGVVLRARTDGRQLAEGWFDVDKTRHVDPRVLERLERGQPMELSTGLFTDNVPAPANSDYRGKPYSYIATNFRPDHLAVLPDQIGACSLADGCGVLINGRHDLNLVVNSLSNKEKTMAALSAEQREALVQDLITNCDCWTEEDQEILNSFPDEKLQGLVDRNQLAVQAEKDKKEGKDGEKPGKSAKEMTDEELEKELLNRKGKTPAKNEEGDMSADEWIQKAPESVQNTFRYAQQIEQEQKDKLIERLTANIEDDAKRRAHGDRLRQRSLDDLKSDLALLPPEKPKEQPAANEGKDGKDGMLSDMLKKLTAHNPDDDLLELPTMNYTSDTEDSADEATQQAVANTAARDVNPEEWLRSAPEPVRQAVENALRVESRERDEMINQLVANVSDPHQRFQLRDMLEKKPLDELRQYQMLMGRTETKPKPNFAGAAGASPTANTPLTDDDRDDILPLPSMELVQKSG